MVSAQKIKYNGVFSNEGLGDLDIILEVAFDSDNGVTSSYLNRSAVASESYDGRYKNTATYRYDELFSPQFTIVKKDFSDFTQEQVRRVLKYLTSTDKPSLLEVYYDEDSNIVDFACVGGWTTIEMYKLANSRTVAIVAQFEAITPYAMSDIYTITKTISSSTDNQITIEIDTDDNKPVYPRITIQEKGSIVSIPTGTVLDALSDMVENTVYFNGTKYYWKSDEKVNGTIKPSYDWDIVEIDEDYTDQDIIEKNKIYYYKKSGKYYWIDPYYFHSSAANPNLSTASVKFTNTHTDFLGKITVLDSTIVKNNNTTEVVTLDGANKIVSSNSVRRIFGDDFNLRHLELYDGKNEIVIEGNCDVTFEWREVRKIGAY